mmetsp:Transcript_109554/g.327493  ORF Transcript_109554/g.327493 Transcript_109554/m.327493 type:complete len:182 (+) Transcript_109554:50-595(+)
MADEADKAKAGTEKAAAGDADSDDSEAVGFNICYARKKILDSLREKLKKGEEITKEQVGELTTAENVDPEEMMVPVDMSGLGEHDIEDIDAAVAKIGAKALAEAFVKAEDLFETSKADMPEDSRPEPMTAKEWKELAEQEGEEEDDLEESEEEEGLDEEEEEEEGAGGGAEEPAAKKPKTS